MMEITLRLSDGQKKTYSEQELVAIVEEHEQIKKSQKEKASTEYAQVPTEGKWFKVNPLTIDQKLFKAKREDSMQEETRQLILEAFEVMRKNSKYARPFKTMMPKKCWSSKMMGEISDLASKLGDHNADWVEQALEWAQRIANGEVWEDICNKPDTANWNRVVIWNNGYFHLVGGACLDGNCNPPSYIEDYNYGCYYNRGHTVPLVVMYE